MLMNGNVNDRGEMKRIRNYECCVFQLHKSNRLWVYVETLQGEFLGRCLRQLVDLLSPERVQGAGEEASEPKPDKDDQYKVRSFLLLFSSFLLFSSSLLLSVNGLRLNSVNIVVV